MAAFSSYDDRARQRRALFFGGAMAAVATLATPRGRQTVTRGVLTGMERLGRLARVSRELPLRSTMAELQNLFTETLPRAARTAVAERETTRLLTQALGAPQRELAEAIARAAPTRKFLMNGAVDAEATLLHRDMRELLSQVTHTQRQNVRLALDQARARVPTLDDVIKDPVYQRIQAEIRASVGSELQRMGQPRDFGALDPIMQRMGRKVGVRQVRLGEASGVDDLFAGLRQFAPDDVLKNLPVGRAVHYGGRDYDLRGFHQLIDQIHGGIANHFQVPLAPGAMGINPLQLFPWRQGRLSRSFGEISHVAIDPQLRAHLGSAGRAVGQDVYKIGGQWLSVDFGHVMGGGVGEAVTRLPIEGELRTGLYGFMRRRTEQIERALDAKARIAGSDGAGLREWLGLHAFGEDTDSTWRRLTSVFDKFKPGSTWAPRVLDRVLSSPASEVGLDDFQRAAGFLASAELSPRHQAALLHASRRQFGELSPLLDGLSTDQGVLDFYRAFLDADREAAGSDKFRQLVNHFRASPEGVLDRFQPGADRAVLGWNFFGQKSHKDAIQLMREGIVDEAAFRVGWGQGPQDGQEVVRLFQGMNAPATQGPLNQARRYVRDTANDEAIAWAYGRFLKDAARPSSGEKNLQAIENAIQLFQGDPAAQEAIARFTARRTHLWDAHIQPEAHVLRTSELFSQKGYSFLGEMNRQLKETGGDWMQSFRNTVRGPWSRQYLAYFTGNQKDVTETTLMLEYLLGRRLNDALGSVGIPGTGLSMALPDSDLGSGWSVMQGLLLKRVLPAAAAYELYRYADYKAAQLGIGGPSDVWANIRGRMGETRARLFGTSIFGVDRDLLPGLEKFLPERDLEEEREHQRAGWEPVRKGRFWFLGSREQFWGSKISYYLPSATQVARSDWQGAENVDLNTRDYWAHSWLPLPENAFLGPFARLADPNWWERKHSMGPRAERPYPISSEAFDPSTFHGPFLNAALGWIVKPQEVLHPEYVPRNMGGTASQLELRRINEQLKSGADLGGLSAVVGGGGGTGGRGRGGGAGGFGGLGSPGVLTPRGRGGVAGLGEITPGGQIGVESMPGGSGFGGGISLEPAYQALSGPGGAARLSRRELAAINRRVKAGMGGLVPRSPASLLRVSTPGFFSDEELDTIAPFNSAVAAGRNLTDLAGLYGFLAERVYPFEQKGLIMPTAHDAFGYGQRFYELELGGLGGEFSEIGRRFMPRSQRRDGSWNPVPNTMASWLPGGEYFLDFRHGDPYAAIPRGEMRLPGEAYERLHPNLRLMQTRASSLGGTVEEIMRGMLFLEEPMSKRGEEITGLGTQIHRAVQERWKAMGVLLGAEDTIVNRELGISGHYDAVLRTQQGPALTDIKTVSAKRYLEAQQHGALDEHATQLNFYMHETGIRNGFITYVNRDALDEGRVETFLAPVRYSQLRFERAVAKVQTARKRLQGMVDRGLIHRGDLYDPVTRFEILSDVAPYSEQYQQLRQYLTSQNKDGELTVEDNARFQAAKKRSADLKKGTTLYPYRFRNVALDSQNVTVEKVLDETTLLTTTGQRVRLAGVDVSQATITEQLGEAPEGMSPAEWMFAKHGIRPGSRLHVLLDADPLHRQHDDVLGTIHGVVMQGSRNLNRQLLHEGIAEEKETDWSSSGVTARFSPGQIRAGALWESFAHLDTPFHTKFLRTRSPLEELERGIVFGKNNGSWIHPIRDYVGPSIESFISRDPLWAGVGLGTFLQFFARTKEAKLWTFGAGLAAGALGSIYRGLNELGGEPWKPARTRTREELEEYWDILKYTKIRGLAAAEDRLAEEKEGVNVDQMVRRLFSQGEGRDRRRHRLEDLKRRLMVKDREGNADRISRINDQLERLSTSPGAIKLGPHALRALQYRQLFRSTLYGIDPEDTPFKAIFSAFPKYKRELLTGIMEESSPEERERIFRLLPDHEKRVLGKYMGIDEKRIPDRPKLRDYFKKHPLPGPDWEGWRPDVDLEQLRQRAIRGEGLDPMESGIFELQIDEAEQVTGNIPVPTMGGHSHDVQRTLNDLLSGRGLKNVRIQVETRASRQKRDEVNIHLDLQKRKEQEIRDALQIHG